MKTSTTIAILITAIMVAVIVQVNAQCIECPGGTATGNASSVMGMNNSATGDYSFAGGVNSVASGGVSFAFGVSALASAPHAVALGGETKASYANSIAIGSFCSAEASNSFVIGTGVTDLLKITNTVPHSLVMGFGSTKPTFFIGPSNGWSSTGKIGIGDVTDPQAKLHIKADNLEAAEVFIEPHLFGGSYSATLWLGTKEYGLRSRLGKLEFKVGDAGSYLFNEGNLGVGTAEPTARLQVKDGDIFIEDIDRGIIMKSPDGNCWRGTLDNTGALQFVLIDCTSLVGVAAEPDSKQSYKVQIYPNPASNEVTIEYNQYGSAFATFRDLNGALIIQRELKTGINRIGLENLSRGYYLLTVMDQSNRILASEKVMKQ